MNNSTQHKIHTIAQGIAGFLEKRLRTQKTFGLRTFYGYPFTLALLEVSGQLSPEVYETIIKHIRSENTSASHFHWEFYHYALYQYKKHSRSNTFDDFLYAFQFRNNPTTNWTLLRNYVKIVGNYDRATMIQETKTLLMNRQAPSGLIVDEPSVLSFQYHCFSLAILSEIYEETNESFFLDKFLQGLEFIKCFILSNGISLYVGRGQEQIFGYAALIYVLAKEFALNRKSNYQLNLVVDYLIKFLKKDGALPLALNTLSIETNEDVDLKKTQFMGWYSYNNFYDYLPFSGYFLWKASELLKKTGSSSSNKQELTHSYHCDGTFLKISQPNYDAVVSKPGGAWTNDLPIPFIVYKKNPITPCYGGEQFCSSLYKESDLPLPQFPFFNTSIRKKSFSTLSKNQLSMLSPLGFMTRKFTFENLSILVSSRVYSLFSCKHHFLTFDHCKQESPLLLKGSDYIFLSDQPLQFVRKAYCALGELNLYEISSKSWNLRIQLLT